MEKNIEKDDSYEVIFESHSKRTAYIVSHPELIKEVNCRKKAVGSLVSLNGIRKPICKDGILRRGEIVYEKGEAGSAYWTRMSNGHEEKDYYNSKLRILVATKDSNEGVEEDEDTTNLGVEWDIRTETLRCNQSDEISIKATFAKTYIRLISLLVLFCSHREAEIYGLLNDVDKCRAIWEKAPLARINLKKQPGKDFIKSTLLTSYISLYKDVLRKQVRLLKPTIIINSAGKPGLRFFKEMYNLECVDVNFDARKDKWLFYDKEEKIIVVDIYHLSCVLWNRSDLLYYKEIVRRLDYIHRTINFIEDNV